MAEATAAQQRDKPQRHCVSVMFLLADHPSLPPHTSPPNHPSHQTQPSSGSTARPGNSACDSAGGRGEDQRRFRVGVITDLLGGHKRCVPRFLMCFDFIYLDQVKSNPNVVLKRSSSLLLHYYSTTTTFPLQTYGFLNRPTLSLPPPPPPLLSLCKIPWRRHRHLNPHSPLLHLRASPS